MKLNLTTEYAIRMIVYLSKYSGEIINNLEIFENIKISRAYALKIAKKLQKNKIIYIKRGVYGGIYLAKPPEKITLLEIVRAMEGTIKISRCLEKESCYFSEEIDDCKIRRIYEILQYNIEKVLHETNIKQLL